MNRYSKRARERHACSPGTGTAETILDGAMCIRACIAAKDRPTQFVVHYVVGHGVERTVVFGAGVVDVFVLFGGGEQHDHVELQRAFGAHENDQCVWWQRDGEVARSFVENGVFAKPKCHSNMDCKKEMVLQRKNGQR